MQKIDETQMGIVKKVAILCAILTALALFLERPSMAKGLIFGSIIGSLNLRLLVIAIFTAVTLPPYKARVYAATRYLIRSFMILVVLYFVLRTGDMQFFFSTVGGLFLIKVAAIWEGITGRRK